MIVDECPICGGKLIFISIDGNKYFKCNDCTYEHSAEEVNLTFKDALPSPDEILSTKQLLFEMGKTCVKKICRLTLDYVIYPLIERVESHLVDYRSVRM